MTNTVIAEVITESRVFPLGTVEELYHFQLIRAVDGTVASEVTVDNTGVSFPLVTPGDYIIKVTKNGVMVVKEFNIPKTEEVFDVPVTITITIEP